MRWSVSLLAEGDRVISLDEVVELADAVAGHQGVASGMGTHSYGVLLVVQAGTQEEAMEVGMKLFAEAASSAGLPEWPIVDAEVLADEEESDWYHEVPEARPTGEGRPG